VNPSTQRIPHERPCLRRLPLKAENGQADKAIRQFRTALGSSNLTGPHAAQQSWRCAHQFRLRSFPKGADVRSGHRRPLSGIDGLQIPHPGTNDRRPIKILRLYFSQAGQAGAAVANFQKGLGTAADNADAHKYLAWILATCPDASVRNGTGHRAGPNKRSNFPAAGIRRLPAHSAAAYAEAGRFPEAVHDRQKALQLVESQTTLPPVINDLRRKSNITRRGCHFVTSA